MPITSSTVIAIWERISKLDRERFLLEGPPDPPSILLGIGGSYEKIPTWFSQFCKMHRTNLLRTVDLSDDEMVILRGKDYLDIDLPKSSSSVSVRAFTKESDTRMRDGIALNELVASSSGILAISVVVASAMRPFISEAEEFQTLAPPRVTVTSGSVNLTFGGDCLLLSGVGIVLAAAGIATSPILVPTGVGVAVIGAIDLALKWWQLIKTTNGISSKTEAEIKQIEASVKKTDAEIVRINTDTQKTQESNVSPPASSLISHKDIKQVALAWQSSEQFATHMINRALPIASTVSNRLGDIEIKRA